ncbi:MAG: helix-turn-helix transcriptional regulator [Clostridia bacterium]|nr:helix-turn-helix transcriptional regulator [Clostridia bacterium]
MKEIHFSENLKNLRKQKNITQAQLARILCVDQRTVSAWEKGVCEPSLSMLALLCDFFEETFDNLLL